MMRMLKLTTPCALILLGALPAALAVPGITNVQGTMSRKAIVTMTGAGFGAKSTATPVVWDDFESGSLKALVGGKSPVVGPPWSSWSNGASTYDPSYTDVIRRPGSQRSVLFDFANSETGTGSGYTKFLQVLGNYNKSYFTYWLYFDKVSAEWTANFKPWVVYGSGSGTNSDEPVAYAAFGSPSAGDGGLRSNLIDNPSVSTHTLWGGSNLRAVYGRWVCIEMYLEQSSPGAFDGKYKMWVHKPYDTPAPPVLLDLGDAADNGDAVMTRTTQNYWRQWWAMGAYICTDSRSPNARANLYGDDFYFDVTQARVEIGDTPAWLTNTHREIQIPSAWSDISITFKVNQGSFADGQTGYLFVVDASGNASVGKPITFGGTPPAPDTVAPTAPSNLNVK